MMDSKQIEIEWMKELLKENELEIWRLRKEIKNLKEENKKFKADTEHTIKFNNKIIGELKLENKKLKEELKIYKKQYKHTMWGD